MGSIWEEPPRRRRPWLWGLLVGWLVVLSLAIGAAWVAVEAMRPGPWAPAIARDPTPPEKARPEKATGGKTP